MNWLDVLLLVIIGLSVVSSFRKGLTREVIGLASLVLGLLLGAWFYGNVAALLENYLKSRTAANLAGFLIIFLAVAILGAIVRGIIGKFVKVTGLTFLDHILGAAFGTVRGVLVCVALIMGVMAFSPGDKPPQSVEESRLAPYVSDAAKVFVAVAPKELKDGFHKGYDQAQEVWKKTMEKSTHPAPKAEKGSK
jgi:membrane protein required for colicin V production